MLVPLLTTAPVVDMLTARDLHRLSGTSRSLHSLLYCHRKTKLRELGAAAEGDGAGAAAARWRYWESCARVATLFPNEERLVREFERCLGQRRGLHALEQTGTEGEILRDATRTFPKDEYFASPRGKDQLADVLRAVATYAPSVGYCQGMNFVAATMLCTAAAASGADGSTASAPDLAPAQAFALLSALVCNLDLRDLWRPGVPQLKLRIFQFDRLLRELCPHLWAHFRRVGLTPDYFASQWFLTLLSINLPRPVLLRVWDVLLAEGWKTVFKVGICLLRALEPKLKEMSLEDLGMLFKTSTGPLALVVASKTTSESWIREAVGLKGVTTRGLVELEGQYVAHILAQQLSDNPDIHGAVAFVDRRVAALVREEIARLDGPTKTDVSVLRARIELTERALRDARDVFLQEAREFNEVQADVEELQEAKRAVLEQIRALSAAVPSVDDEALSPLSAATLEHDFAVLQSKIESVEAQLLVEGTRFGGVLWRTAQAQVDLEEALERKKVFSEQLLVVLEQNELNRTRRMKMLFRELNTG